MADTEVPRVHLSKYWAALGHFRTERLSTNTSDVYASSSCKLCLNKPNPKQFCGLQLSYYFIIFCSFHKWSTKSVTVSSPHGTEDT